MSRLLVPLLALSATLAAQTPPAPPAATEVRFDVRALRDGDVVPDLQPSDLRVLEDGVPQEVDSLQFVGDEAPRTIVVFLDTLHGDLQAPGPLNAVRLLERATRAGDRVGVLTPDMAVSSLTFHARDEALSRLMESAAAASAPAAVEVRGKETLYDACYPDDRASGAAGVAAELKERRRERLTLDAIDALVAQIASSQSERTALIVITAGWRLFRENRDLGSPVLARDTSARDTLRRRGAQTSPARRATGVERAECEADRVSLAGLNHSRRLREIIDRANRATVSFYPVSQATLGMAGSGGGRGAAGEDAAREDSLTQLAGETEGAALLRQADVDRMVERLSADGGGYYLLGYRSTNRQLDGRFRAVNVQSLAPGVQVRTRRGYRGLTAGDLFPGPRAPEVVTGAKTGFRTRTAAWQMPDGDGRSTVWLVGEIDHATRKQLAWTSGAQADVTVLGADGEQLASTSLAVPPLDGSFALRLPESGGLAPGEYALRVELRPLSGADDALLDTFRLVVSARPAALGEPVLWRRGPSTGLKHVITAAAMFQRSERIRVEMATSMTGTASARLLDRLGNPLPVPIQASMRDDASGAFNWLVADASLAPLAVGDYSIELSLHGASRTVSFRVVP